MGQAAGFDVSRLVKGNGWDRVAGIQAREYAGIERLNLAGEFNDIEVLGEQ